MKRLWPWLAVSLSVASMNFLKLPVALADMPYQAVAATVGLGVLWIAIFVVALAVLGKRALWLLLGAPFALAYPALFAIAAIVGI
jgi:hypothetical protein